MDGWLECGIDGCKHETPYAHLLGKHRKTEHGIDGQSETARRRRAQMGANPLSPPTRVVAVVKPRREGSFEWGPWTDDDVILLRALSVAWREDMPGTIELLRTRTMATIRRDPAVRRLLRQENVAAEERRKNLRTV